MLPFKYLLDQLRSSPEIPIPDLFNTTFHEVDNKLSQLAQDEGTSSGCTAVTAFLRLEDEEGRPVGGSGGIVADENSATVGIGGAAAATGAGAGEDDADAGADGRDGSPHPAPTKGSTGGGTGGGLLSGLARRMRKGGSGDDDNGGGAGNGNDGDQPQGAGANVDGGGDGDAAHVAGADAGAMGATENTQTRVTKDGLVDVQGKEVRRVLYTANVGDARAVLW